MVVLWPSKGMENAWSTPSPCLSPSCDRHCYQSLYFSLLSADSVPKLSTASSPCQSPRVAVSPSMPACNGPGLESFFCSQLCLSLFCHRKPLPSVSQSVPALISICYYNSRIEQEVIIWNACFIFISLSIFYTHKCISNFNQGGGGGINDSETIKKQNYAVIKMNSACIDHISLSQNVGHFQVVHGIS